MKKSTVKLITKLIITLILLYIFLLKTNISEIIDNISQISFKSIILVVLLFFLAHFINTLKWLFLLPRYKYILLIKFNFIGLYYSLILPGQLSGEVIKAYKLGKGKTDAAKVAASVFIDKITGIIGLLIVGILGIIFTNREIPKSIVYTSLFMVCVCFAVLIIIRINTISNTIKCFLCYISKRITFFNNLVLQFLKLIEAWKDYAKSIKYITINIIIGIIYQLIAVYIHYIFANELGIYLNFLDWCWIYGIVSIALFLPITIGGIGLREGSFISILGWLGIGNEKALTLSFCILGLQIFGALLGGVLELFDFSIKKSHI